MHHVMNLSTWLVCKSIWVEGSYSSILIRLYYRIPVCLWILKTALNINAFQRVQFLSLEYKYQLQLGKCRQMFMF